jgi:small subunit ribosomal protein S9
MTILAKAVGRRKEAVAQVKLVQGTGLFLINNKPAQDYLQNDSCSLLSVKAPFDILLLSTAKQKKGVPLNGPPQSGGDTASMLQSDNGAELAISVDSLVHLGIDTIVKVKGGGLMGQSEAIRLGISRAICLCTREGAGPEGPLSKLNVSNLTNELISNSLDETASSQKTVENSDTSTNFVDVRKQLKDKGYLTQDSRVKERRKYGLKKARKASQYHKR